MYTAFWFEWQATNIVITSPTHITHNHSYTSPEIQFAKQECSLCSQTPSQICEEKNF